MKKMLFVTVILSLVLALLAGCGGGSGSGSGSTNTSTTTTTDTQAVDNDCYIRVYNECMQPDGADVWRCNSFANETCGSGD